MKGADLLESDNFNDLCINRGLKVTPKLKCQDFEKYDGEGCLYTHLKLYGADISQYHKDDKLLACTGPLLSRLFMEEREKFPSTVRIKLIIIKKKKSGLLLQCLMILQR